MTEDQGTISKRSRSPNPERNNSSDRTSTQKERRRRRTGWDVTDPSQAKAPIPASPIELASQDLDTTPTMASPPVNTPPPIPNSSPMLCRIYVGSLDYYLTVEEIKRVFEAFGTIVTIDMPKEGDRSKGFCFVEFATPESAEMALSSMQGFLLKGRNIKVGRPSASGLPLPQPITPSPISAISPSQPASLERPSIVSPTEAGAIAAAAMISSKTNQDITTILKKTGSVSPNVTNGILSQRAAITAAGIISSSLSSVDPSQPSASRIYVGNIPSNFTSTDLERIFSVFGKILSCYVLPNNDIPGTHRGYGFIDFSEPNIAKLAIEAMNNFPVADKNLKVNYAASVRQPNTNFLPSASTQILIPPTATLLPSVLAATGANSTPLRPPPAPTGTPVATPAYNPLQPISQSSPPIVPPPTVPAPPKPTRNKLKLSNMVDPSEIDDYLKTEIRTECMKYGQVVDIDINIINNEAEVFITFASDFDASRAFPHLHGRLFAGRQISCQYVQ